MKIMETTFTKDQLPTITAEILKNLHNRKSKVNVIALHGDLGSGKTTLTQEIGKMLGIKDKMISPTFVIMKKYEVKDKFFKHLIHIDAYRLNKSAELLHLGFEELLKESSNLIIIEWPENVPECIPQNALHVELAHKEEGVRIVKFRS